MTVVNVFLIMQGSQHCSTTPHNNNRETSFSYARPTALTNQPQVQWLSHAKTPAKLTRSSLDQEHGHSEAVGTTLFTRSTGRPSNSMTLCSKSPRNDRSQVPQEARNFAWIEQVQEAQLMATVLEATHGHYRYTTASTAIA